jgi:hypothetical protein
VQNKGSDPIGAFSAPRGRAPVISMPPPKPDYRSPEARHCRVELLKIIRRYCPSVVGITCEWRGGILAQITCQTEYPWIDLKRASLTGPTTIRGG